MYLNKSNKGIGWYSYVDRTEKNEELKGQDRLSINFVFKKDCAPLTDDSIKGELYFIDESGNKRKVRPFVDTFNGGKFLKFRLYGIEGEQKNDLPFYEQKETQDMFTTKESKAMESVDIKPDDLPFY